MSRAQGTVELIVCDLDGTLIGGDLAPSPRVWAAVGEARGRGVAVTLATGRMYRSTLRFAAALGLDAPLICYQGAYVREPPRGGRPGRLLRHLPLGDAAAADAITWSRAHDLDPHVNVADRLVMEVGDEGAADYERLSGIEAEFVPDLLTAVRGPVTKVLAVGPAGIPERVLDEARVTFAGRAEVTVSHPEYLEFTAPGVNKGEALRWLARRLHVPLAATMAIGDQYNDLEMIAAAGLGVAMAGAPPTVRAAARYVTASVEEDGAALAIEALVLGRGVLD